MLDIILVELAFLVGAIISSYLTWGPLTSREMVDYFGPEIHTEKSLTENELYERKRKAGMAAEFIRAVFITVLGLIIIPFYSTSVSVASVLQSQFFQFSFLAAASLAFIWNVYVGPRIFAMRYEGNFRFFSREHFRKYIRPYWAWLPYPLLIWAGIGLLTFMMIVGSITIDVQRLQFYVESIQKIPMNDVEQIQFAIIRLTQFGNWITSASQKYILTTLLIFLYVVIEQRSSMQTTILDSSVERLKYAVWTGLVFTIGFSLIVLPLQFESLHLLIRNNLESLTGQSVQAEHLNDVIGIHQYLQDHDLQWLLLRIVMGYGNLVSLAIVGFIIFLWRLYFHDVPLSFILKLVVPKYIIKKFGNFAEGFRVDLDIKKDNHVR